MKHVTHYVLQGMRKSIKMPVNYERVKGQKGKSKDVLWMLFKNLLTITYHSQGSFPARRAFYQSVFP